jgi:two-component system chemotaxis sensor kinase CheA
VPRHIPSEIETETEVGMGTTLTIKLPLTLSIIDGLLVKIDTDFFVLPLSIVDKIYAVEHENIDKSFNNVVVLDGVQIPYFYLRKEFEIPETTLKTEEVVVIQYENKKVGLIVDNVVGEYQAVLKPLGKMYKHQEFISGATILGDGTVALVMDTNKTVKNLSIKHNINQDAL